MPCCVIAGSRRKPCPHPLSVIRTPARAGVFYERNLRVVLRRGSSCGLAHHPRRVANGDRVGGDIPRDHGPGTDYAARPQGDTRADDGAATYPDIILYGDGLAVDVPTAPR